MHSWLANLMLTILIDPISIDVDNNMAGRLCKTLGQEEASASHEAVRPGYGAAEGQAKPHRGASQR